MANKPKFKPFEKLGKDKEGKGSKEGKTADKKSDGKFPAFLKKK